MPKVLTEGDGYQVSSLTLHAMGCSRVIKNNDILFTTIDYQSWDQVDNGNNDEWFNTEKFHDQIVGGNVIFFGNQCMP